MHRLFYNYARSAGVHRAPLGLSTANLQFFWLKDLLVVAVIQTF